MPEFPRLEYTMGDVRRAGQALATDLIWTDETAETIRQVCRIANNWRGSEILRGDGRGDLTNIARAIGEQENVALVRG